MPELPEVHTTVTGLQKSVVGLTIKDIWSDMWSTSKLARNTIKDKTYFPYFKKYVLNQKIISASRRAKYILINLENGFTMIIHMKMTGHLMYGNYKQNKKYNGREWSWIPAGIDTPLHDPYNRHIHVVFTFSNTKKGNSQLAFCDSRKFGTIVVEKTSTLHTERLKHLGPEPLEKTFTENNFKVRLLLSPKRSIKTVLMDQTIIAGIGNIYSDEMLHRAHIKPTRTPKSLKKNEVSLLFKAMKHVLTQGIDFGGDSMSDYRNIEGSRGKFQTKHLVYLRTGEMCKTRGCKGIIKKQKIGGRSAHYCPVCQK
ncbi:MAG: bifunctional DNA-formamidopyrimidine glycosylase/DNA-(apurinic or apyrimidinic site) lyase [Candidatus Taylorbacteria bacterium]|nr:bifunctional DNA-formamidopyrimidine glycosylase/DNA-(apurinic or apyrimidinic site) lyase [Candidatus Taylorbacteria bacterium]